MSSRLAAKPSRPGTKKKRAPKRSTEVAGVDLQAELDRLARLPAFGGEQSRLVTFPAQLHIRRASARPRSRLAFASYDRHLIHITDYPGIDSCEARETLLHECVHLSSIRLNKHDASFKRTLVQAAREAFGVDCSPWVRGAVYKLDVAIVEAMRLREGYLRD